ncbi:glycosyltransferase [Flavobacterium sediminis]|uniref:glycosyltransferase n=1 Tax=Flavobacterium sediminis TaxID=2201181 RepID=UPI001FE989F7|nr:glycosyltransferase [Flavobacterium sediminis]
MNTIQQKRSDIQVVTFGKGESWNTDIISLGEIQDERLLALLYSAADLFIMSSIEEAFGQVTIEALACGLPVVSFPTGGSIDIIKEGENGILAKDFTANELAKAIAKALSQSFDLQVITDDVQKRFDIKDKVSEYRNLYETILQLK